MAMQPKKRGPKGKGGVRIIVHLWPQQIEALDDDRMKSGGSRAELIRRAIDAQYFKKRRETDKEKRPEN